MLFSARIIIKNKEEQVIMLIVIACGFFVLVSLFIKSLSKYSLHFFLATIVIALIAILFINVKPAVNNLKEELFVKDNCFEISSIIFPFKEITNLNFSFNSFNGMKLGTYDADPEAKSRYYTGSYLMGAQNFVSFKYKKQDFKYEFFVENQQHFYRFVNMLEQLYSQHMVFSENNWYGKTFLMQNVNEEEVIKLKEKY